MEPFPAVFEIEWRFTKENQKFPEGWFDLKWRVCLKPQKIFEYAVSWADDQFKNTENSVFYSVMDGQQEKGTAVSCIFRISPSTALNPSLFSHPSFQGRKATRLSPPYFISRTECWLNSIWNSTEYALSKWSQRTRKKDRFSVNIMGNTKCGSTWMPEVILIFAALLFLGGCSLCSGCNFSMNPFSVPSATAIQKNNKPKKIQLVQPLS